MKNLEKKSLAHAIGINLLIAGSGYIYMGRWVLGIFAFIFFCALATAQMYWAILVLLLVMTVDMYVFHKKHSAEVLENATKDCPKCAEKISVRALKCKHCGSDLPINSELSTSK